MPPELATLRRVQFGDTAEFNSALHLAAAPIGSFGSHDACKEQRGLAHSKTLAREAQPVPRKGSADKIRKC